MPFIQIIEYRTSRFEEIDQLRKEWQAAVGSDTTARRRILARDRNDAERYFNIVFFDSYEDAMRNSGHPATQEFAAKQAALVDGAPTFFDLDVVEEAEL